MKYNDVFNIIVIPLRANLFSRDHVFTIADTDKLNALNNFSVFLAIMLSDGKVGLV